MSEELVFKLADNLEIRWKDYEVEGLRITILARSGAGKSNLAALFAEQSLGKIPVLVVEPIEEWWTLRNIYDGVVWAGPVEDGADLPVVPDAPGSYVEVLEKGGSLVLTAGVIEDELEEKRFVGKLLASLYQRWKRVRTPMLLIIEDAEGYFPQMWGKEDRYTLSQGALIAKRGRKLGINMIVVSQRPAELNKTMYSQANILFFGGFKTTRDLEAVKAYSKLLHYPIPTEEIAKLEPGEFYACMGGEVIRIKAYRRRSPHGGTTPRLERPIKAELKGVVSELRRALSRIWLEKKRELDRVKQLESRVKELETLLLERDRTIAELRRRLEMKKIAVEAAREVVKEVPVEVKVKARPVTVEAPKPMGVSELLDLPAWLRRAPYGVIRVYRFLRERGDWVRPIEIRRGTGLGRDSVRRSLIYLYNKGAIKADLARTEKRVFLRVKLKE